MRRCGRWAFLNVRVPLSPLLLVLQLLLLLLPLLLDSSRHRAPSPSRSSFAIHFGSRADEFLQLGAEGCSSASPDISFSEDRRERASNDDDNIERYEAPLMGDQQSSEFEVDDHGDFPSSSLASISSAADSGSQGSDPFARTSETRNKQLHSNQSDHKALNISELMSQFVAHFRLNQTKSRADNNDNDSGRDKRLSEGHDDDRDDNYDGVNSFAGGVHKKSTKERRKKARKEKRKPWNNATTKVNDSSKHEHQSSSSPGRPYTRPRNVSIQQVGREVLEWRKKWHDSPILSEIFQDPDYNVKWRYDWEFSRDDDSKDDSIEQAISPLAGEVKSPKFRCMFGCPLWGPRISAYPWTCARSILFNQHGCRASLDYIKNHSIPGWFCDEHKHSVCDVCHQECSGDAEVHRCYGPKCCGDIQEHEHKCDDNLGAHGYTCGARLNSIGLDVKQSLLETFFKYVDPARVRPQLSTCRE